MACTSFGYDWSMTDKGGLIGTSSCVGKRPCHHAHGQIGDGSCLGEVACFSQTGTIGDHSCTKAKGSRLPDVDGMNYLDPSCCAHNNGMIGDRSCTEQSSCQSNGFDDVTASIGNDSCNGVSACHGNNGEIGDSSW